MFDFSLAETSLTMLVALLLIGPEELPGVIRSFRNISRKSKQIYKEFTDKILEIEGTNDLVNEVKKINEDIKKIADADGNLHDAYDISDIMPEIEKAKTERNKKTGNVPIPDNKKNREEESKNEEQNY